MWETCHLHNSHFYQGGDQGEGEFGEDPSELGGLVKLAQPGFTIMIPSWYHHYTIIPLLTHHWCGKIMVYHERVHYTMIYRTIENYVK